MRRTIVEVIARKELAAITRSRALWMPMVLVNVILFLVLPLGLGVVVSVVPQDALADPEMVKLIASLPPELRERFVVEGDLRQTIFTLMVGQLFVPLFLIAPIMTASLMAADAFAGERERKTLEALLYSPASALEIFAGKVAGALLPAVLVDVAGLALFSVTANAVTFSVFGRAFVPSGLHASIALLLGPAIAALAVVLVVLVSARVKNAQEANQVAALLVLPVVALLVGQLTGVAFFGAGAIAAVAVVVAALAALLLRTLARRYTRDALFLGL